MHTIHFLDNATFPANIHFKKPNFEHQWHNYATTKPNQTISHLHKATIAITNKVIIDEATLEHCPSLEYIAVAATGVNVVDLSACKKRNIVVANVTNYATQSVAEHVFMLLLSLYKNIKGYSQALEQNRWQQNGQFCFFLAQGIEELHGKTLGLIGTGNIALATAKIATAFGMNVLFFSPSGRQTVNNQPCVKLNALLAQADVVSVHCPLSSNTHHLINTQTLKKMKPNAVIINTARGPIIDENAVITAVKNNQLAGAGLDVFAQEPPDFSSPVMATLNHPRIIITPHVAWASLRAMQALADQLIQKIEHYVACRPIDNLAL